MPADSDSHHTVPQAITLELEILRLLCSAQLSAPSRDSILRSLAHHTWQDAEHRVVYEALRRVRGCTPAGIREELPAAATRMGFPDTDWSRYFAASEATTPEEIEALVRALDFHTAPGPSCS